MSEAYLNLIKAAKQGLLHLQCSCPDVQDKLEAAIEAAEKELEPWQREELNASS